MEVLDLLKAVHVEAVNRTIHMKFDKKHPWHLLLVGLYGTLVELSSAIVLLIESKRLVGVPILARSFLEAYIDFSNLEKDRTYGNYMQAAYDDQWLKVLREAKEGNNPFLVSIAGVPNLDTEIQEKMTELDDLKQKG